MPRDLSPEAYAFQVDLRGLVDLLSQHLYSSPRVYIRELLQNAVDATTARRAIDPAAPDAIRIVIDDAGLRVTDSGIGLTEADAHQFLATIGQSSKRDDLAGARREFLGQFGIGLLACFTVADQIRVVTRSAREPDAADGRVDRPRRRQLRRARSRRRVRPARSPGPPCTWRRGTAPSAGSRRTWWPSWPGSTAGCCRTR